MSEYEDPECEMPKGRSMVYRYGLLRPKTNADIVRAQMELAHRYRNTLVQIERGRRDALRALMRSHGGLAACEHDFQQAKIELGNASLAMSEARKASRSRSETKEMRERVAEARANLKKASKALSLRRKEVREDASILEEKACIEGRAKDLRKNARKYCGVYWGTYLLIEDQDRASRQMPLHDGIEPNNPKFRAAHLMRDWFPGKTESSWGSNGQVGVQVQNGMPADEVFGDDVRVRIAPVDERAWHAERRGERRRHQFTTLSLRVGSTEGRGPVWAEFPMLMHRPLPKGSIIKRVNVSLRHHGPREEWSVEITVDLPANAPHRAERGQKGFVAVDLGWRLMGEELRVAVWRDDEGKMGELRLSAHLMNALRKPADLWSILDRGFNEIRKDLAQWMTANDTPDWLKEATRTMPQWHDRTRMLRVCKRWLESRFAGDEDMVATLEAWRVRDRHLWRYGSELAISSLRRRRDLYRCFAADLAKRYRIVVFEDVDLRLLARKAKPEDKADNETARRNRMLAAVGDIRSTVENAFNGDQWEAPTENSTITCHVCGLVERFDKAKELEHTCSGCRSTWDQDENAAWVLGERWRVAREAGTARTQKEVKESAGVQESSWARAKRMKAEKEVTASAARNTTGNDAE